MLPNYAVCHDQFSIHALHMYALPSTHIACVHVLRLEPYNIELRVLDPNVNDTCSGQNQEDQGYDQIQDPMPTREFCVVFRFCASLFPTSQ